MPSPVDLAMHHNHLVAAPRIAHIGPTGAHERVGPWDCIDTGASDFPVGGAAVLGSATAADIPLALEWFEARAVPPKFELRSDADADIASALQEQEFHLEFSMPAMLLLDPKPWRAHGRLQIKVVERDGELERYGRVNWERNLQHIGLAIAHEVRRLGFIALLGTLDGVDVGCSMAVIKGQMVGVYNVGVAPPYRRRGFGETLTAAAITAGLERGATMASLGASDMGKSIYERMGFRTRYHYDKWVRT